MSKNPTRNYAIEYVGGKQTDVESIVSAAIAAAADPSGDPVGDVIDTGDEGLPLIETLPTEETETNRRLRPNGSGGVQWMRSPLPEFVITDYGAVIDDTTDDTVAIRDTIAAAVANGGGAIVHPGGNSSLIAGSLLDTGAFNGQIVLPDVAHSGVDHLVLEFRGPLRPGFHPLYGDTPPLASALGVYRSALAGASGSAAVFSGGNNLASPGSGGGNNLEVNVRDLICLGPDNPTFTFWNLGACQGGRINDLQISTPGAYSGSPVLPTNTNAYGIKLPQALFSNGTRIDGLAAGGFYTGVLSGELAAFIGPLILGPGYYGIEIPLNYYPAIIMQLTATNVVRVIRVTTDAPSGHKASHGVDILQYIRESAGSGSFNTEYDLYDPSNRGAGYIRFYTITAAGGGAVDTFLQSGGTGFLVEQLGGSWGGGGAPSGAAGGDLSGTYPNPSVVDDSHSHTTATAPGGGLGPLLLASDHSTPIVFDDILQASDGADFLYASEP